MTDGRLAELQRSRLFNADLAAVPAGRRQWRVGSFAALWISMSACIPTYMLALCIATLATNLAANVVSPANDFANLAPRRISFRLGGLITALIGLLMMPWKLVADPNGYIFTWLIAYSALLGPIGGILIADYFVCRRRRLNLPALYLPDGEYRFTEGFSLVALGALALGALPSLPGFLVQVKLLTADRVAPWLVDLYNYAWFIGFAIAFVAYLAGRRLAALAPPAVALDRPQTAVD